MKSLLLTGFEPFLDHPINPTQDIVKALDQSIIGAYKIEGRILPVVFGEAGEQVIKHIEELQPDAIISLGLSAGRTMITPERVAINCQDGEKDNAGKRLEDEPIVHHGHAAYFTTLPIRKMVNHLQENHLPSKISNTAGTYVCNHVMYRVLHYLHEHHQAQTPAGFIHVPASHELMIHQPKYPGWSTNDLVRGIELCIEIINDK